MRPARFQDLLATAVAKDGKMVATTYAEAGITRSLYGLILDGPVKADVQIVAMSAPDRPGVAGDDYKKPERVVTGNPHPALATNDRQPVRKVTPDTLERAGQYLAALAIAAAPDEFNAVRLYAGRAKNGAVKHGATFGFYDGSAIFMYIRVSD